MLGKTENYGTPDDPWPVQVPGLSRVILSTKITEYVSGEFWYYYNFYNSCKHGGPPYSGGWLDWPPWIVQLITAFDTVIDHERRQNEYRFLAQIHGYKVK